jgi:hypothetical protein
MKVTICYMVKGLKKAVENASIIARDTEVKIWLL